MTFYIEKVSAKNQYKLSVDCDMLNVNLEFLKNKTQIKQQSFILRDFIELINDYHRNGYGINEPYINRKFIKKIKSIIGKTIPNAEMSIYIELARILAILPIFYPNATNDSIEFKIQEYLFQENSKLYNYSCVDWTGDLGTQPSIYFISKELYNNINILKQLHNLELLDCVCYKTYTYYYVPFSKNIDNISQTRFFKYRFIIQTIVKERSEKLMENFNE